MLLRPRHTMRQIATTRRGDKSPRLHCCCDKSLALSLSLRYVARIQTSLNLCDRSQGQNSVAATMILTCHTTRFVAATCGDVSQRFVASCVSAFILLCFDLGKHSGTPTKLLPRAKNCFLKNKHSHSCDWNQDMYSTDQPASADFSEVPSK